MENADLDHYQMLGLMFVTVKIFSNVFFYYIKKQTNSCRCRKLKCYEKLFISISKESKKNCMGFNQLHVKIGAFQKLFQYFLPLRLQCLTLIFNILKVQSLNNVIINIDKFGCECLWK